MFQRATVAQRFATFVWWSWWPVAMVSALLGLLALATIPFLATFDGHFYLAGSRALFTPEAPDLFWWLREPGYSLLIKAIRGVMGPSDLWITGAQYLAVLLGGFLGAIAVWRSVRPEAAIPPGLVALGLLLGVGNASVLYYSSAALQQSVFVLSLGAALFLGVELRSRVSVVTLGAIVLLVSATAWAQEEFGRLVTIPIALGVAFSGHTLVHRRALRLLAAIGVLIALQVMVTLVLLPWNSYRSEASARQSASLELPSDFAPLVQQVQAASSWAEPHPFSYWSQLTSFVGFTGSAQFESRHFERDVYIQRRQNPDWACGAIEGMPVRFAAVHQASVGAIDVACRSGVAIAAARPWTWLSVAVYPYVLLLGLITAVGCLWRRREMVVSSSLLLVMTPYVLLGFGADRYSVPLFPPAVSLILTMLALAAARRWPGLLSAPTEERPYGTAKVAP